MSSVATDLLLSLKNFALCNQDLTARVKDILLGPLQQNPKQPHNSLVQPPSLLTENDMNAKEKHLLPLALRIVNQNIDSLKQLKEWKRPGHSGSAANINTIQQCLIDTSFYAISALKLMERFSSLKPLDIEKTTSNLICKLVDLGEWERSLDELRALRQSLASVANIQLSNTRTTKSVNGLKLPRSAHLIDPQGIFAFNEHRNSENLDDNLNLKIAPNQQSCTTLHDNVVAPLQSSSPESGDHYLSMSSTEAEMITRYADLFTLTLNTNVSNRNLILLVLAYQMNVIRSWCDIDNGGMVKYIAMVLNQPGNFIDWCKHLMSYDDVMAKKQLALLQRHLSFTMNKMPKFDNPLQVMAIQFLALKALAYTDMLSLNSLCEEILQLATTYEKNSHEVKYDIIQGYCSEFLPILKLKYTPSSYDKYYMKFCEYHVFASRKANINSGVIQGLTSMYHSLNRSPEPSTVVDFHLIGRSCRVKLTLCTAQLDQMALSNSYIDIMDLSTDTSSTVQSLAKNIQNGVFKINKHTKGLLVKVCQAIHNFIRSANLVYEMIQEPRDNCSSTNTPQLRRPHTYEVSSAWKSHGKAISDILQQCGVLLPIIAMEEMKWADYEPEAKLSPSNIVLTNVNIMVLLAKLHYDPRNDATCRQSYDHLATAEQLCSDNMLTSGYRQISAAYYTLGTGMITTDSLSNAIYPLRMACALLEKDSERMDSDAGKIQLVKRYETLGTCCQKTGDSEGAKKAYCLALKHLPATIINLFTTGSDRMPISKMIDQQPLVSKLINRFLRAAFNNSQQTTFSTDNMDLSTLTPIQKCVLYECELKILFILSLQLDLMGPQSRLIDSLLHHYTADQYPIRRGRALLYQVRMIHANGLADKQSLYAAIKHAQEARCILTNTNYGFDKYLSSYQRHYLALACSWLGILRHEVSEASLDIFVLALHHWGDLFKKIKPLSSTHPTPREHLELVYKHVDDFDSLYNHLRLLADLFGLIGHCTLQINTLRLLLKLNNGLRSSETQHVSDSITVSIEIGRIYMDLGYTGKASLEFEKAKLIMEIHPCSLQAELHYLLQYCHYLTTVGELDKSLVTFETAKARWETSDELETCNNSLWSMELQANKYFMLSDCYLARSGLSLHKESLNSAIMDAHSSYQILCSFLQFIKQHLRSDSTDDSFLNGNYDNPECTWKADQLSTATLQILFKKYQWATATKMGSTLQRLANLNMIRGSWRDAQYYLEQGQQLGERIKSNAMEYHFLLLLHSSYLRTDQIDKSRSTLKLANEIRAQGHIYLQEEARWVVALGHASEKRNMLDDALESFCNADLLYRKMMEPACIAAIGKLSGSDEDLEPEFINPVGGQHEENNDGVTEYECISLQEVLCETAIYKALVMARKGLKSTALDVLAEFEEPGSMLAKKNFLVAVGAHIRLTMVENQFHNHGSWTFLGNSVFTVPFLLSPSLTNWQMQDGSKTAQNIQVVEDKVAQALESLSLTFRQCANIENVDLVASLCRNAGSALFLRNRMLFGKNDLYSYHSTLTGYYLDMAKSIGLRREFQCCLDQKLMGPRNRLVNNFGWPRRIGDIPRLDSRTPVDDSHSFRRSFSLLGGQSMAYLANLLNTYQQEHNLTDTEFQTQFINILPPNWTVCSLSLDSSLQGLYVTRYCADESPLVVKLPLDRIDECSRRWNTRRNCGGITYEQAISEFKNIIQLSDETIRSNKDTMALKDVEDWWVTRSKLDTRMKNLLEQIERTWIGGFKGLFCGRRHVYERAFITFQESFQCIVLENIYGSPTPCNKRILNMDEKLLHIVLSLGINPMDQDVEDVIYFILACYESCDTCIDYSGTMIGRMTRQIRHAIQFYHDQAAQAGINTLEQLPNHHIILIPDKFTQILPWESLPILRSQPVSRLPCLSFLRDRILHGQPHYQENRGRDAATDVNQDHGAWIDITVDPSMTYYLLNPSGDLKHTQAEFEPILSRMHNWEGQVQVTPSEIECRSMLMQKDLYIYFGHGAGQSLISGQTIRQLPRCPVALLMGCSSGRLESHGEFDTGGYVMNYLLAGSPAVVVNLWDVTDKSIDLVSKGMMNRWNLFNKAKNQAGIIKQSKSQSRISLVEALSLSRDDCPLPYLSGAATVVYGVPVYVL